MLFQCLEAVWVWIRKNIFRPKPSTIERVWLSKAIQLQENPISNSGWGSWSHTKLVHNVWAPFYSYLLLSTDVIGKAFANSTLCASYDPTHKHSSLGHCLDYIDVTAFEVVQKTVLWVVLGISFHPCNITFNWFDQLQWISGCNSICWFSFSILHSSGPRYLKPTPNCNCYLISSGRVAL